MKCSVFLLCHSVANVLILKLLCVAYSSLIILQISNFRDNIGQLLLVTGSTQAAANAIPKWFL